MVNPEEDGVVGPAVNPEEEPVATRVGAPGTTTVGAPIVIPDDEPVVTGAGVVLESANLCGAGVVSGTTRLGWSVIIIVDRVVITSERNQTYSVLETFVVVVIISIIIVVVTILPH